MTRNDMRDELRRHVLTTLDTVMNRELYQIGYSPRCTATGARDADLPELFSDLDRQLDRNLAFFGITVIPDSEA